MIQIPPPMTRPVLFAVIPARVHPPAIIFYFYRPCLASSGCLLQSAIFPRSGFEPAAN